MNFKQMFFLLSMLAFTALIMLLGESFLKIAWMALGAVLLLVFSREVAWDSFDKYRDLLMLWAAFLGWLVVVTFLSLNVPMSLQNLAGYFFSAGVFIFFLGLKQSFIKREWILMGIGLVSGWLTLISGFFLFFPTTARILPGMNLVFSTFGHNHIAAIMVLVIPAAWWVALTYGSRQRWWTYLLPIIATITLMVSFSRVATAVAVLETIAVVSLYVVKLRRERSPKKVVRSFKQILLNGKMALLMMGVVALVGLLAVKVGYSIVATSDKKACPTPIFKKELCKPLKDELRLKYWQASIDAFRAHPWVGYGPGTTYLSVQRYRLNPTVLTTFAHNHFLQTFSETGLVGGLLFMALMGGMWWRAYDIVRQQKGWFTLNQALLVGITANFVVAFFDIDWSFIATYTILLVLITQVLRSASQSVDDGS